MTEAGHLRRILRMRDDLHASVTRAKDRREQYRQSIAAAIAAGVSQVKIAEALGVTTARVRQLKEGSNGR